MSDAEAKQVTKQVWIEFMEKAHQGLPVEPFIAPTGVRGVIIDIKRVELLLPLVKSSV